MHEVIRGGTYRDVTNGTLVRVDDTFTHRESNETIIAFAPVTDTGPGEQQQLAETEFLQRYSLVV